jgi:hypothetical protein
MLTAKRCRHYQLAKLVNYFDFTILFPKIVRRRKPTKTILLSFVIIADKGRMTLPIN